MHKLRKRTQGNMGVLWSPETGSDGVVRFSQEEIDELNAKSGKKFTQDEVNTMMANDKKKLKKENEAQAKRIEKLAETVGLDAAEKLRLQNEAEELREAHLTDTERIESKYKRELAAEKLARETAETSTKETKNALAKRVISEETLKAANKHNALKPEHMLGLLPNTPEYADGKVTVKIGDDILSLDEAVEAMKKDVDNYGIYFGNAKVPGQGGDPNVDDPNKKKMTMEEVDSEADYDTYLEDQKTPEQKAADVLAAKNKE